MQSFRSSVYRNLEFYAAQSLRDSPFHPDVILMNHECKHIFRIQAPAGDMRIPWVTEYCDRDKVVWLAHSRSP